MSVFLSVRLVGRCFRILVRVMVGFYTSIFKLHVISRPAQIGASSTKIMVVTFTSLLELIRFECHWPSGPPKHSRPPQPLVLLHFQTIYCTLHLPLYA